MTEFVILVDQSDNAVGFAEKLDAHSRGLLHRAFSIFVFDSNQKLLLQRRAVGKYHSGGLWSNTCCGHPRPDEEIGAAAERRLFEEMGFTCSLDQAFQFTYCAKLDGGLVEHEFDYVFIGTFDGDIAPDPDEVSEVQRIDLETLRVDCNERPDRYTHWLRTAMESEFWNRYVHARCEA